MTKPRKLSLANYRLPKPATDKEHAAVGSAQQRTADASDRTAQIAAEVRAGTKEIAAYTESIFAIMREHGNDCDVAAKHLQTRVQAFQELGPRMMKIKESLQTLSEADRERVKQESEQIMLSFKAKHPDVDAIEQMGKDCEKTSKTFAEVAPGVFFVKKK